jgi:membrane fusion protein, adhesin transport system
VTDAKPVPQTAPPVVPQPAAPAVVKKRPPPARQVRLLAQAIALEEGRPPRAAMLAVATGTGLFIAATAWAALTQVDKVAIAPGQIVPTALVQSIQHFEGGIVREILVREGSFVDRDEVILRLDATGMQAELDQLRAREAGLALQIERLRAFAERRPAHLDGAVGGSARQVASDQEAILRVQVRARDSQRLVLERQLAARQAELSTLNEQRSALVRQAEIVGQTLSMRRQLLDKGLISRVVYLETERETVRLRGEAAQALSNIRRAQESVAEAEARLLETEAKLASDSLGEMGRLSADLAQVREGIARAIDRVDRLDIRAPVRGVVKDLRFRTVGGVIAPGAPVTDIVPVEQGLLAEVKISPRDVGHVRIGQEVVTKISTYDFARYGVVPGKLASVSATTFQEQDGQVFYKGFVKLDRIGVGPDPATNPLLPGMVLQADIRLGSRSVLEYLFTPIYVSLASALHER